MKTAIKLLFAVAALSATEAYADCQAGASGRVKGVSINTDPSVSTHGFPTFSFNENIWNWIPFAQDVKSENGRAMFALLLVAKSANLKVKTKTCTWNVDFQRNVVTQLDVDTE
jgi:hypothetical protein